MEEKALDLGRASEIILVKEILVWVARIHLLIIQARMDYLRKSIKGSWIIEAILLLKSCSSSLLFTSSKDKSFNALRKQGWSGRWLSAVYRVWTKGNSCTGSSSQDSSRKILAMGEDLWCMVVRILISAILIILDSWFFTPDEGFHYIVYF